MNQELARWAKQQLEKEKKHLMHVIDEMDDGGLDMSLAESIEELSTYDQHPADVASEVFERSKDFALRENAMIQVRAINQALQRIQEGTYGLCEACSQEIPLERLKAVPYTTYCVNCRHHQEILDDTDSARPVEEDLLEPSLAKSLNDSGDKNMYDAEDTWQDLAAWQEHAPHTGAGSYYGGGEADEEPIGYTEMIDHIPYLVDDDGVIYQSTRGMDDEMAPVEQTDVGLENQL